MCDMGMQASLDDSLVKLKEAQQALQSVQSSGTAQQVQLTQQLTSQTERLATAQQVGHDTTNKTCVKSHGIACPNQEPVLTPVTTPVRHTEPVSKPFSNTCPPSKPVPHPVAKPVQRNLVTAE